MYVYIFYYIPSPLTVHFPITRRVRYQPIFNTLFHATLRMCIEKCSLNYHIEIVEIMDGRVGKHSVQHVMYVINT